VGPLRDFGDILDALDRLQLPVFAINKDGAIRWLNMAAESVVGDKRGARFTRLVAPESQAVVRDAFASKVIGARQATDYEAVLVKEDGSRVPVEVCSVPVNGDSGVAGVFGAAAVKPEKLAALAGPIRELTPRQAEVLSYLAHGYTTGDIADVMGVAPDTVRNHIRELLRKLGAHSRLEAVTIARLHGLV
jgi:DNA-binding NarL/FixJ family response regulator